MMVQESAHVKEELTTLNWLIRHGQSACADLGSPFVGPRDALPPSDGMYVSRLPKALPHAALRRTHPSGAEGVRRDAPVSNRARLRTRVASQARRLLGAASRLRGLRRSSD